MDGRHGSCGAAKHAILKTVTSARRLLCVVLQCALLTMSLVSGGYACGSRESNEMQASTENMPGMPMHGPDERRDKSSQQRDCPLPWAPDGCQLTLSCVPNAMTSAATTVVASLRVTRDEPLGLAKELRSVTRSPEPPPPRA
jgi:hypothetical protein